MGGESLKLFNGRTQFFGHFFFFNFRIKNEKTSSSVLYFLSCHEVETATDRPTKGATIEKQVHTESMTDILDCPPFPITLF